MPAEKLKAPIEVLALLHAAARALHKCDLEIGYGHMESRDEYQASLREAVEAFTGPWEGIGTLRKIEHAIDN